MNRRSAPFVSLSALVFAGSLSVDRMQGQALNMDGQSGMFFQPWADVVPSAAGEFGGPTVSFHIVEAGPVAGDYLNVGVEEGFGNRLEFGFTRNNHTDGGDPAISPLFNFAGMNIFNFKMKDGTLLLWHREDSGEALRAEKLLASRHLQANVERIEGVRLGALEPALGTRFSRALHIAGEAQVDNRALLQTVASALTESKVECHWETFVMDGAPPAAGIVVDCRGMGAKRDWPQLRGVRGEIVRLYAPDIELRHTLRLLHPRYAVYIVPRAEGRLVVGATSIESNDCSTVSVRGALELLTSSYSVLPALAEARILEFNTQVRPALPDNAPAIRFDQQRKVLRINGLYRHGFLLTPAIVEEALALLSLQPSAAAARWSCVQENCSELILAPIQDMRACL